MGLTAYTRTPNYSIQVVRPDYTNAHYYKETEIVTFGTAETRNQSTACIQYEFQEQLLSPEGEFSFVTTLEADEQGYTWYDKISTRDLVRISEHGKVRFVGYVTDKRYVSRMGSRGPERSIMISGKSLGGLLVSFSLLINQSILSSPITGETAQKQFMEMLAANVDVGQALGPTIVAIKDAYFNLMEAIGGNQNLGVKHILTTMFDFSTRVSPSVKAWYPVVVSAFQTGENNLWSTLQQVLNPPFHEIFGLWDPDAKKYDIWVRQTPFDPSDWMNLPITRIPEDISPVLLVDYNIGASDRDVKTFFICTLPGSGIDLQKALTVDDYAQCPVIDKKKWPYYGFKPLYAELKYFNRSEKNQQEFSGANKLMRDLSQKLYDWYANNAEFLSGSLTLMNVQDNQYRAYPRIGERLGFLGGEFYIEQTKSSWTYGGPMLRTLAISRGYVYTATGKQQERIQRVGPKVGVLEEEGVG